MVQFNPFSLQSLEGTDIGRRTIFEQARPDSARTLSQRNIFSGLFERVLNDYLGNVGKNFSVGETPSQSFTDFVEGQDFNNVFKRQQANFRRDSGLSGPARFLFDL